MKPHEIKADVGHFRILDARVALETHVTEAETEGPRRAAGEMDLASSLRVLFSLFDEKRPTEPPKR